MFPEVLTVAELNRLARSLIEREFPLLWVAGEVSNLTRASSGHLYFTLKDEAAQVRCAMFRNRAQLLPWRLENGQQVEARALVSLYEPRGDFQLNVEAVRQAGLGKLYESFLRLKDKLGREGLLDESRKRPPPLFPRAVGVVTSPQAAALQDVLAALARRASHLAVIIYPTLVQGKEAPAQIAAALDAAAQRRECDVLLLVRGGGSLEDLWAFNEEAVARAVVSMPMPVIAGIGHETDVTIADLAADRRAATPTAAAELASGGWFSAATELAALADALGRTVTRRLESFMQRLDVLGHRLAHPAERLARDRRQLDHLATRLVAAGRQRLHRRNGEVADLRWRLAWARPDIGRRGSRLEGLAAALAALSPQATLSRGYAIVRDGEGQLVRDSGQLQQDSRLSLRFAKGSSEAIVTRTFPD
jgi:exodeoxyribonuclease VII large subunit